MTGADYICHSILASMNNKIVGPLRALLLDDEPDACRNLQTLLEQYWSDNINVIGVALNTDDALEILKKQKPEVVFIDIEMPGENAFQFLNRIAPFDFEIIFVTAYDEYALRALKLNAIDYILKPISLEELGTAIRKLEEKITIKHLANGHSSDSYDDLGSQMLQHSEPDKIVLRSKSEVLVLNFEDIIYIEAKGSYAYFHYQSGGEVKTYMMSRPLMEYEEILPDNIFYRIHKSFLLNGSFFYTITKGDQHLVILKNNTELPLSRRRLPEFLAFLKKYNFKH